MRDLGEHRLKDHRSTAATVPAGRRRAFPRSSRRLNTLSGRGRLRNAAQRPISRAGRTLLRVLGDEAARRGGLSLPRDRRSSCGDAPRACARTGRGPRNSVLRAAQRRRESCTGRTGRGPGRPVGLRRASLRAEVRDPLGPLRVGAARSARIRRAHTSSGCATPPSPGRSSSPTRQKHCWRAMLQSSSWRTSESGRFPGGTGLTACSACRPEGSASALVSAGWSAGRPSTATAR